jgi:Mn2+/Fe2+ NRAMP family transporter
VTGRAGDDPAAWARRRGGIRASHADREQVIDTLKAAYVYGFVTKDEFDQRVSETLASHTRAELALITADIPAGLAAAPATMSPATAKPHAPAKTRPIERAIIATATLAALAFVASFFATNPMAGLLALAAVGSGFSSVFLVAAQIRGARRDKRPGGQLPPRAAISTRRTAGQLSHSSLRRWLSLPDEARSRSLRPRWST